MSKTLKTILIALAIVALVGAAYLIGRGGGQATDPQVVEIPLTIFVRAPGSFTVLVTPVNPETGDVETEITKGTPAVFTITTAAVGGYDGRINFTLDGLPTGTVVTFSANDVAPGETVTLTIQTTGLVSNTAYVTVLAASPA